MRVAQRGFFFDSARSCVPSAAAIASAFARHHLAVQDLGEAMRGAAAIFASGAGFVDEVSGALWRHDPERPDLVEGGLSLRERIVFTIRKTEQESPFAYGTIVRCDQISGKAFRVVVIGGADGDAVWHYEATRAPGSDA